ncbi:MAG TPA: hypothetical protein VG652_06105 [Gaiellaceae bacterium]|nr:hypothetical protein [Gaiellaceae bacterium]
MKKRVALAIVAYVAATAPNALAAAKPFSVVAVRTSSTVTAKQSSFTEKLLIGKKNVGKDAVKCKASGGKTTCAGVFTFTAGGTITINGALVAQGNNVTFKIAGGTGPYAGAAGTLKLAGISSTQTKITFELG